MRRATKWTATIPTRPSRERGICQQHENFSSFSSPFFRSIVAHLPCNFQVNVRRKWWKYCKSLAKKRKNEKNLQFNTVSCHLWVALDISNFLPFPQIPERCSLFFYVLIARMNASIALFFLSSSFSRCLMFQDAKSTVSRNFEDFLHLFEIWVFCERKIGQIAVLSCGDSKRSVKVISRRLWFIGSSAVESRVTSEVFEQKKDNRRQLPGWATQMWGANAS